MTTETKPVPTAKRQFIAKPLGKKWGVYDTVLGSWPLQRPGFGVVATDLPTEEAAQAEADRLEGL